MKLLTVGGALVLVMPVLLGLAGRDAFLQKSGDADSVSYRKDVMPVLAKYCLPCHAEESYNPSELSLDSYTQLRKGGKHGDPVVPGKPQESILMQKLLDDPPFGDRMPLQSRRQKLSGIVKKLTTEEVSVLRRWISQGAKED
jgi:hypothetical protein